VRVFLVAVAAIAIVATRPANASQHSHDVQESRQIYNTYSAQHLIVHNSPYEPVLQQVGARISEAAEPHWFAERFFIVRDNSINAFATPGGYVFVNEGLLRGVDNADELAAALGHETAHLVLGHLDQREQSAARQNMVHKMANFFATKFGSQNALRALNAASLASRYGFLNYSRQQEYAADRYGTYLAARAGYNPWGSVWLQDEVERLVGDAGYEQYLQQHPSTRQRIAALRSYIESHPSTFGRWHNVEPSTTGLLP
jgi:beta-barrel assembly-enhancing protease